MGTGAGNRTTAGGRAAVDDARICALRLRVYSPDASEADVAALAAALAASAAPPPPAEPVEPPSAIGETLARVVVATPATRAHIALRRVPPRLLVAGLAVAVVGAVVGAAGAAFAARTASAGPRAVPRFAETVAVPAPAGLLDAPPRAADRPTALVGPDLVPASFRHLAGYPAAGVTLWAARDRFGETCLVVADTYYRTACAEPATAAEDGLVIGWSGGPGYPASTTESYTAVWRQGRLTAGRAAP